MARIKKNPPSLTEEEKVEEFIRVARRVEAHPVAGDKEITFELASQRLGFHVTPAGQVSHIDLMRVDEVVLESWALRTRRLEAKDDPVHFPRIMKIGKSLVNKRGNEPSPLADSFDTLRSEWNGFQSTPPVITNMVDLKTGEEQSATSLELVDAWRNGHMFHGDPEKKDRPELMTHNEMVLEVGYHLARVTVYTVSALNLLTQCHEKGLLPIDPSCFTDQVVYDKNGRVMAGLGEVSVVGPHVEVAETDGTG